MSEWNKIVTGLEYDMPEVDDVDEISEHDEEIYQSQMDWCPDMRDEI